MLDVLFAIIWLTKCLKCEHISAWIHECCEKCWSYLVETSDEV